jgi:hypothetical protein
VLLWNRPTEADSLNDLPEPVLILDRVSKTSQCHFCLDATPTPHIIPFAHEVRELIATYSDSVNLITVHVPGDRRFGGTVMRQFHFQ